MLYVLANIDEMDSEVDDASSKHSLSDTTFSLNGKFHTVQNIELL